MMMTQIYQKRFRSQIEASCDDDDGDDADDEDGDDEDISKEVSFTDL